MRMVLVVCVVCMAACNSEEAPARAPYDCMTVGDAFVQRARERVDSEATALASMLPKLRGRVVKECRAQAWAEAARRCFVEARTRANALACAPPVQPPLPEEPLTSPAAAPSSPPAR